MSHDVRAPAAPPRLPRLFRVEEYLHLSNRVLVREVRSPTEKDRGASGDERTVDPIGDAEKVLLEPADGRRSGEKDDD